MNLCIVACAIARPSVCPSVTWVDQSKMVRLRLGTCESFFFRSNLRIESAVYHARRSTA